MTAPPCLAVKMGGERAGGKRDGTGRLYLAVEFRVTNYFFHKSISFSEENLFPADHAFDQFG